MWTDTSGADASDAYKRVLSFYIRQALFDPEGRVGRHASSANQRESVRRSLPPSTIHHKLKNEGAVDYELTRRVFS